MRFFLLAVTALSLSACIGLGPEDSVEFASSCADGRQNQGEIAVDCGGPCPACSSCQLDPAGCADACQAGPIASDRPAPRPATSMRSVLEQTGAIVEGVVTHQSESYDRVTGPRTAVTLSKLRVHAGNLEDESSQETVLDLFGGHLPDGREISATTVPQFADGQRALVFLRNTRWSLSPVVGLLAFDIRSDGGVDHIYHGKNPVVGISEVGIQTQSTAMAADSNDDEELRDKPPKLLPALTVEELLGRTKAYAASIGITIEGRYDPKPTLMCKTWNILSTVAGDAGRVRSKTAVRDDLRKKACLAAIVAADSKDFDSTDQGNACSSLGGEQ